MNPLIVKGVVFGLLLACAALWDMKEREIPNLIPAMILVCGLIELRLLWRGFLLREVRTCWLHY